MYAMSSLPFSHAGLAHRLSPGLAVGKDPGICRGWNFLLATDQSLIRLEGKLYAGQQQANDTCHR